MNERDQNAAPMAVAIVGLGAIGREVALKLAAGVPGVRLAAVAAGNAERARSWLVERSIRAPVLSIDELASVADIVVECAPARVLPDVARTVLSAGKRLVVLSVGALLDHPEFEEMARRYNGRILIPTGALIGLDAVKAAAEGTIRSVRMITRKPVKGLLGAPYLEKSAVDIAALRSPLRVFAGTAREAAAGFPSNLNVAAALALAGIGPDRTEVEIWADPSATRNEHRIEVDSDAARFSMTIANVPSENPRTGRITAQSVVALLRKLGAPIQIGT